MTTNASRDGAASGPRPPPPSDALVTVDDLTMGWEDVNLLEHASFTIQRGEVFCILGGSGCGKSTLLRYLTGLEQPKSGTIQIEGVGTPTLEVGRPAYGVMFQSGALFGSMTVGQNVALSLREWTDLPDDAIDAIVKAKLSLVGLDGFEDHHPSEISGGMKKRAAIARAMALEPSLLFLDEPSAGLDPVSSVELDELILALNSGLGLTVVLVSHELQSIFKIATRCIMLDKVSKSIIAEGDPRKLRDTSDIPQVRRFFNRGDPEQQASEPQEPAASVRLPRRRPSTIDESLRVRGSSVDGAPPLVPYGINRGQRPRASMLPPLPFSKNPKTKGT